MKTGAVGGQAVIEGVMMKSKKFIATAVRKENGKIVFRKEKSESLTNKNKILGLPFIRGIIILVETLVTGFKALNYSTREATAESEEKISTIHIVASIIFAVVAALVLFKLIPLALAQLLKYKLQFFENRIFFNLAEGLVKIAIFVGYIYSISLMKDIKRVFAYHGAEHKAIYCYENKKKLSVANARKYSTLHPRCGTSFILLVLVISILVYCLLPTQMSFFSKYFYRILLLPAIAGVSYEFLKLSARYKNNFLLKILISPGLLLQKITTKEPDSKQLEVALFALNKVI